MGIKSSSGKGCLKSYVNIHWLEFFCVMILYLNMNFVEKILEILENPIGPPQRSRGARGLAGQVGRRGPPRGYTRGLCRGTRGSLGGAGGWGGGGPGEEKSSGLGGEEKGHSERGGEEESVCPYRYGPYVCGKCRTREEAREGMQDGGEEGQGSGFCTCHGGGNIGAAGGLNRILFPSISFHLSDLSVTNIFKIHCF